MVNSREVRAPWSTQERRPRQGYSGSWQLNSECALVFFFLFLFPVFLSIELIFCSRNILPWDIQKTW